MEYQAQAQEKLEQRLLQLTARLEEQHKYYQAERLLFEQHSQQSAQRIALLTEQMSQHETEQQQLTLFTINQQEHITSLEERLEQVNNHYVKMKLVKPKPPYY